MAQQKRTKGERMVTPKARLSWPSLFKPASFNDKEDPRYSAELLMDLQDPTVQEFAKALHQQCLAIARVDFGDSKGIKMPFSRGDERVEKGEHYRGMLLIKPWSYYAPDVILQNKQPARPEDIYPGCYIRASVIPSTYDHMGNKGVRLMLGNVQKWADGEPLVSRGTSGEDEFESLSDDGPLYDDIF